MQAPDHFPLPTRTHRLKGTVQPALFVISWLPAASLAVPFSSLPLLFPR